MPSVDRTLIGNHIVIQRPENNELLVSGPDDGETVVNVTPDEFILYRILNDHRGRGVEREDLINELWSGEKRSEELLDKTASGLRRKLQDAGIHEDFIETAPGKRYRMIFNQNVQDSEIEEKSLRKRFSIKALWILLINLILAGIIFYLADMAFPGQEEVPQSPVEIEAPPLDTDVE